MTEHALQYEEWRDTMLRLIGETDQIAWFRARAAGSLEPPSDSAEPWDVIDLWHDEESELSACMARCEPARSPAAQLRWLAALCRESGRYAGDRVGAEAFASLLHLLVFPGFCGWLRPLTRVELREEAIDTIRAFTVLYREYFGPIVGDDLPSGPRHSFEDYSRVHFLCHMLWDMSPLGILEGSLRDAGRGVLADVLKLPWGGCQHGALLGILFYGRFPEFRQLAREFLEREPRPPERLCNMARWAGADDP